MKKIFSILVMLISIIPTNAQDVLGSWFGALKVQGTELHLVFNISEKEGNLSATMDSPDQGAKGIPCSKVSFENLTLKIEISSAKIEYEGVLNQQQQIIGTFKQGGQSFAFDLSRKQQEKAKLNRPQEPSKPYPYLSEDVVFENKTAEIQLAGTLTLPNMGDNFPVVILISGSGPQNRNEELLGHKPFLVIADYLTKNGIAVLRYDDRGTASSKGDFKTATSADFASDAIAALEYLKSRKEINKKKIGLIGHSEGGVISPMVAAQSKDVAFIVLLAGTGIQGDKLLLLQEELIGRASGVSEEDIQQSQKLNKGAFDIVVKSKDKEQLQLDLKQYFSEKFKETPNMELPQGMTETQFVEMMVKTISSPWMQYFMKLDPAIALKKVKCPVLALNGEKDLQVPPKENLSAIKNALESGGNKKVTTKEFPNMNHLFQTCETGNPSEYEKIEETFSPVALNEINAWIQLQVK